MQIKPIAEIILSDGRIIRVYSYRALRRLASSEQGGAKITDEKLNELERKYESLDKLTETVNEHEKLISELLQTFREFTDRVQSWSNELRDFRSEIIKRFEIVTKKLEEYEERIRLLEKKVADLVVPEPREGKPRREESKREERREITERQLEYIRDLIHRATKAMGVTEDELYFRIRRELGLVVETFADVYTLSREEASQLIEWLREKAKSGS